jgi:hypothetical protein
VLRLNINLFFGENNVFNMFWVDKKLFEASISFSVRFCQLVTPAPYDPTGLSFGPFARQKGGNKAMQELHRWPCESPQGPPKVILGFFSQLH